MSEHSASEVEENQPSHVAPSNVFAPPGNAFPPPPPGTAPVFTYPPPEDPSQAASGSDGEAPPPMVLVGPPPSMLYTVPQAPQSALGSPSKSDSSRNQGTERKAKRQQVKMACTNCALACKKCDDERPCTRCQKFGLADKCVNSARKERAKGVKRGPYRKRDKQKGGDENKDDDEQTPAARAAEQWESAIASINAPLNGLTPTIIPTGPPSTTQNNSSAPNSPGHGHHPMQPPPGLMPIQAIAPDGTIMQLFIPAAGHVFAPPPQLQPAQVLQRHHERKESKEKAAQREREADNESDELADDDEICSAAAGSSPPGETSTAPTVLNPQQTYLVPYPHHPAFPPPPAGLGGSQIYSSPDKDDGDPGKAPEEEKTPTKKNANGKRVRKDAAAEEEMRRAKRSRPVPIRPAPPPSSGPEGDAVAASA